MQANGYLPFAWPKGFPKNNEFLVVTVGEEKELAEALPKCLTEKPYSAVGTHNGVFHTDEILACVLLKYAKMLTSPGVIIRTRNDNILNSLKIVIDVGGKASPKELRYDHHMREFKETFDANHDIKLSSCGLVYKNHGKEVISNILSSEWKINDSKNLEYTYAKVYDEFIAGIDAGDNGINQYPDEIKPKYHINTHLAYRVSRFNPPWNEEAAVQQNGGNVSKAFLAAMDIVEEEFLWQVHAQASILFPAYDIIANAYSVREKFHPSGQFIFLEKGCPWKEHLGSLEEANKDPNKKPVLYIICKDKAEFRVQGVPDKTGSFQCRLYLSQPWRGLRGEELEKVSGIPGAVFVHASGFLGVAHTLEGVIKMAEISIANSQASAKKTN